MRSTPKINAIELTKFSYPLENVAVDPNYSIPVYAPGAKTDPVQFIVTS
jgi:hypothetical protein